MGKQLSKEEEIALKLTEPDEKSAEEKEKETQQKVVTKYDFKHPKPVTKDQLRTMESLHDNYFARLLSSTLSGLQRAVVDVDMAFTDQTTYAEFIMSLSNPSCSYQFIMEPMGGPAVIDFAPPVVFSFVDKLFGGKGSAQSGEARQLTPIEIQEMHQIMQGVREDLEATWEPLFRVEISDAELEVNPEFLQIAAPTDIVILIAFEVNSAHASGLIQLCYPFFTLESILGKLTGQWSGRLGRQPAERQKRLDQLKGIEAEVKVIWGRGRVSTADVTDLRVGDTILLETRTDDPGIVFVEDQPLFLARPGASAQGRYAVELLRSIPQQEVKRYV